MENDSHFEKYGPFWKMEAILKNMDHFEIILAILENCHYFGIWLPFLKMVANWNFVMSYLSILSRAIKAITTMLAKNPFHVVSGLWLCVKAWGAKQNIFFSNLMQF